MVMALKVKDCWVKYKEPLRIKYVCFRFIILNNVLYDIFWLHYGVLFTLFLHIHFWNMCTHLWKISKYRYVPRNGIFDHIFPHQYHLYCHPHAKFAILMLIGVISAVIL